MEAKNCEDESWGEEWNIVGDIGLQMCYAHLKVCIVSYVSCVAETVVSNL